MNRRNNPEIKVCWATQQVGVARPLLEAGDSRWCWLGQSAGSKAGPQLKGLGQWGCAPAQEYQAYPRHCLPLSAGFLLLHLNSIHIKLQSCQVLCGFAALLSLCGTLPQAVELLPSQGCASLWAVSYLMLLCIPSPRRSRVCLPARADPGGS